MNETTAPRDIRIERIFEASVEEVWDMWTTKNGLESWWGPDGFTTKVTTLEVRPGGKWEYTMAATDPKMTEVVKAANLPASQFVHQSFVEVIPGRRLVYKSLVDFVPGIEPYEIKTVVEFYKATNGVRMVVTDEAMHDARWTELSTMGLAQQFDKLGKLLGRRP